MATDTRCSRGPKRPDDFTAVEESHSDAELRVCSAGPVVTRPLSQESPRCPPLHNLSLHPPNAGPADFTVRSASAGEHSDAALARVCCALPTDDLTLGVRG